MEGCLLRWRVGEGGDGGWGRILAHGKAQSYAYCQNLNLPSQLYRLISLSFARFTLEYPVKNRL